MKSMRDIKVHQHVIPTAIVFCYKKNAFTILLAVADKNLKYEFPQFWLWSLNREVFPVALLLYKKIPRIQSIKESKGLSFKKTKREIIKQILEPQCDDDTRRPKQRNAQTDRRAPGAHRRSRRTRGQRRNCSAT